MPNAVHWPVQNVDSGLHVLAIVFSLSPITPEVSDYATPALLGHLLLSFHHYGSFAFCLSVTLLNVYHRGC